MSKIISSYKVALAVALLSIMLNSACSGKSPKEKMVRNYQVKPNERISLYGLDVHKVIDSKFLEVEKLLNHKAQVDSEVAVVFIRKRQNFISKQFKTDILDYIEITYGPIEDTVIYKDYLNVTPRNMIFAASINTKESIKTKESILYELQKILPENDSTKQIINHINDYFILGPYIAGSVMVVNFNMSNYPVAKFAIGFSRESPNEIFYTYTFSKDKVIYP